MSNTINVGRGGKKRAGEGESFFFFFKLTYLFWERQRQHKWGRARKDPKQAPPCPCRTWCRTGTHEEAVRSWPELKLRVGRLTDWATQRRRILILTAILLLRSILTTWLAVLPPFTLSFIHPLILPSLTCSQWGCRNEWPGSCLQEPRVLITEMENGRKKLSRSYETKSLESLTGTQGENSKVGFNLLTTVTTSCPVLFMRVKQEVLVHIRLCRANVLNTRQSPRVVWKAVHSWPPTDSSDLGSFQSCPISPGTLNSSPFSKQGIISHTSVPGASCFPCLERTFFLFPTWALPTPPALSSNELLHAAQFRQHRKTPSGLLPQAMTSLSAPQCFCPTSSKVLVKATRLSPSPGTPRG